MAIAFDNNTNSAYKNGTTNNLTHITSGTNRLLVVYVYSGTDNITGVKYNSVSCSFIGKRLMTGPAAGQYIHMYFLLNPASGSNTVTVTSSSGMDGYITAISYTGVAQSGQPDASTTNGADSVIQLTTSVTTVADNCWIMGYAYHNSAISAGTNTTLRGGSITSLQAFDTNAAQTPAGSYSVQTIVASADFAGHVVASFAPVAGVATSTPKHTLLMMGIG